MATSGKQRRIRRDLCNNGLKNVQQCLLKICVARADGQVEGEEEAIKAADTPFHKASPCFQRVC